MRERVRKPLLACLTFVLLVASIFATEGQGQSISTILTRMDQHKKAMASLRSDIVLGKYDSALKEWDYSRGRMLLVFIKSRDPYLRIDWVTPREEVLSIAEGKFTLFAPRLRTAYVGNATIKNASSRIGPELLLLASATKAQINAAFKAKFKGEEKIDGTPVWHLEFAPKKASKYKKAFKTKSSSDYKNAELWIDKNGMVIQMKAKRKIGDEISIKLTGFAKNVSLKASQFKVNLPKETKIISN